MRSRVLRTVVAVATLSTLAVFAPGPSASGDAQMTQREFIRSVRRSALPRLLSGPARLGLRILTRSRGGHATEEGERHAEARAFAAATPTNLRVNDPSGDGAGNADMTTQSEVSIAVSGSNVVAGYNDDGTSPPPLGEAPSPATDYTAYSWSEDGGSSWHDAGGLPNHSPAVNLGDPVAAADRAGRFYFAELSLNFPLQRIDIAVARSDDGGQTFNEPQVVSSKRKLTMNDKPWMTVGPNPADPASDVVYVAWMESFFNERSGRVGTRIMLTSSSDAGATWTRPKQVVSQPSFHRHRSAYVNGSSLAVDPTTGRVYLAWEQFVDPPRGGGRFAVRREFATSSTDGGASFSRPVVVARPARIGELNEGCGDVMKFGPGRLVRDTEFPSLGVGPGGAAFLAYSSNGSAGAAQVRVARSLDQGRTWTRTTVAGPPDAFMPALSADSTGVTVVYYQRVSNQLLKTGVGTSADGIGWTTQDLSDTSFPVPITFPNFDPGLAMCYMGDYLGIQRVAGTSYTGWGDNRDVVGNSFWPNGRPDPDVFFAKLP